MVKVVVTDREGLTQTVDCASGQSLMVGLKGAGYDIMAICGGALSCATCHVYIEPADYARLSPPSEFELELLEDSEGFRLGSSRLSCQIPTDSEIDGLAVTLGPED